MMGARRPSDTAIAALRREFLRARTPQAVLDAARTFATRELGVVTALLDAPASGEQRPQPHRVALAAADSVLRDWMQSAGTEDVWVVSTGGLAGGLAFPQKRLLIGVPPKNEIDDEVLHELAVDVADALQQADLTVEIARLREETASRDVLLREATSALFRDASEVVRVVSELEQRDEAIHADLQQALRFQHAMLARLPRHDAVAIDAAYLPAETISGDFYDVAPLGSDLIRVFIADATGHGIAAGLATMFIKSEYEAQKRAASRPDVLLASINSVLASTYRNLELRFTAVCMDVHIAERKIAYACAAHPGPLVARASGVDALPSGGSFIGLTAGGAFPLYEAAVLPSDLLLVCTDGLYDAAAPDGSFLGQPRVADILARARARSRPPCGTLVRALSEFIGVGNSLSDDVSFVTLSFREHPRQS